MSAMKPEDPMTFHPGCLKESRTMRYSCRRVLGSLQIAGRRNELRKSARLNLKQTASAAHIYGLREAQAEASPKWNKIVLIGR